jgi:hypothetical protein
MSEILPQMDEDISLSWLQFEEELSSYAEKEHKRYVDLEEAMRLANKCRGGFRGVLGVYLPP